MMRKLWMVLALALLSGCATVPYQYGKDIEGAEVLPLRGNEQQIERGRPIPLVDGLGHYLFSLPNKLILWNWRIENHAISPVTEEALRAYLDANGLHNVKVRLNEYAPGGEWSRLVRNREIGVFWRYTFGALSTVFYTILPGRVFGGDSYNPFTNTINLYSDHISVALHEGGHAKDFAQTHYKGAYAAARLIPLFPLVQEALATGETVGYHREEQAAEAEKDDYRVLYPAYGTYIAGEGLGIASWFGPVSYPTVLAIQAGVAIPGHIIGRIKASQVDDEDE